MRAFILRRLLNLVPILIGISLVTFTMLHVLPGDPISVLCPQHATPEVRRQFRARYHLDDPLPSQYLAYLGRLARGDLGEALTEEPVLNVLARRFVPTLQLAFGSLVFAVLLGLAAGLLSAARPNSWTDGACMLGALAGVSLPVFWLGMILMMLNARLGFILPVSGYEPLSLPHFVLPCIALGTGSGALIARLTRSSVLDVIHQDYVRTARAKGVSEWRILFSHALRNAWVPVLTVIGASFASLLSGAVLTETVFNIPGLGGLVIEALDRHDYSLVVGAVMWLAVIFVIVNLIVDLLYAWLDPRIRYE